MARADRSALLLLRVCFLFVSSGEYFDREFILTEKKRSLAIQAASY
jgi:hypothetical protein